MNEDETINVTGGVPNDASSRPSPYELLVRQSKKMGRVATRKLSGVRHVLAHEIQLPAPEQLLGNISSSPRKGHQEELEKANELKKFVRRSQEVLGYARTVFPITLFPDSITVDRTKVTITKRDFFWTSNTVSFQIEDILNVSCSIGPLFGSLTIASRVMSTIDHFTINYLWRGDAIFFKHLLQGHMIAKQNKLETDTMTRQEMVKTLCDIGMDVAT